MTNTNLDFIIHAINVAHGLSLTPEFYTELGADVLRMEHEFNRQAGFDAGDDELPAFFYEDALPPTNQTARFHGGDVHDIFEGLAQPVG